jgi:hypothetical protein
MSGDSPSLDDYTGGSSNCDFDITVPLASPDRTVTATLAVGDSLDVVLGSDSRGATRLDLMTLDGRYVSGIVYIGQGRLVACLRSGSTYVATIIELHPNGSGTASIKNA